MRGSVTVAAPDSMQAESSPDTAEWTFVTPSSSAMDLEGATRAVENLHVSSTAPVTAAPVTAAAGLSIPTTNPAVAEAVASMKSMGFTDDGGWLTTLLTAHNGDVATALDALNAKK